MCALEAVCERECCLVQLPSAIDRYNNNAHHEFNYDI